MPLTMPASPGFIQPRFGLETNTQTFTSPLTKSVQRVLLGGSRWVLSFSLPAMERSQMASWQAFLLQCEGQANTFYGYDPDGQTPRGPAGGTPLVNGGSQTGSTLNIDGCTASVTGWMRAGDYFSVNGELKMLTADVNTNGSGQATLSFKPALRNSPADNAPLTVTNAVCEMVLADDMQAMWSGRSNRYGVYEGLSISAIEVFS